MQRHVIGKPSGGPSCATAAPPAKMARKTKQRYKPMPPTRRHQVLDDDDASYHLNDVVEPSHGEGWGELLPHSVAPGTPFFENSVWICTFHWRGGRRCGSVTADVLQINNRSFVALKGSPEPRKSKTHSLQARKHQFSVAGNKFGRGRVRVVRVRQARRGSLRAPVSKNPLKSWIARARRYESLKNSPRVMMRFFFLSQQDLVGFMCDPKSPPADERFGDGLPYFGVCAKDSGAGLPREQPRFVCARCSCQPADDGGGGGAPFAVGRGVKQYKVNHRIEEFVMAVGEVVEVAAAQLPVERGVVTILTDESFVAFEREWQYADEHVEVAIIDDDSDGIRAERRFRLPSSSSSSSSSSSTSGSEDAEKGVVERHMRDGSSRGFYESKREEREDPDLLEGMERSRADAAAARAAPRGVPSGSGVRVLECVLTDSGCAAAMRALRLSARSLPYALRFQLERVVLEKTLLPDVVVVENVLRLFSTSVVKAIVDAMPPSRRGPASQTECEHAAVALLEPLQTVRAAVALQRRGVSDEDALDALRGKARLAFCQRTARRGSRFGILR